MNTCDQHTTTHGGRMNTSSHLTLMSKPRLVERVRAAEAETARQRALADYWRQYADHLAIQASHDRNLVDTFRRNIRRAGMARTIHRLAKAVQDAA